MELPLSITRRANVVTYMFSLRDRCSGPHLCRWFLERIHQEAEVKVVGGYLCHGMDCSFVGSSPAGDDS